MKVVQGPMVKVASILSNNNTLLLLALISPQSAATERNIDDRQIYQFKDN